MPLLLSKLLPEFTDLHAHENKVSTYFVISDIFIDTFTESISIIKNIGSGYYYTLIAFSPTERLSVKGQLFKKTSLLRCLSVGNVIDDKLELDHLFLAIFRNGN